MILTKFPRHSSTSRAFSWTQREKMGGEGKESFVHKENRLHFIHTYIHVTFCMKGLFYMTEHENLVKNLAYGEKLSRENVKTSPSLVVWRVANKRY